MKQYNNIHKVYILCIYIIQINGYESHYHTITTATARVSSYMHIYRGESGFSSAATLAVSSTVLEGAEAGAAGSEVGTFWEAAGWSILARVTHPMIDRRNTQARLNVVKIAEINRRSVYLVRISSQLSCLYSLISKLWQTS